jgi:2-polyprenyl-3-methyl-5-hydroxy-6-metoxy-1,4-benzoquinol methylase
MQKVAADPAHSSWYVERFRSMAAAGRDLAGEARLLDAMVGRGARILDAGCGPGRVAAELARLGHDVVGVDVDPVLIEAAIEDHPVLAGSSRTWRSLTCLREVFRSPSMPSSVPET